MDKEIDFNEFIASVAAENQDFVRDLHESLIGLGCKIEIKTAKSGYQPYLEIIKTALQESRLLAFAYADQDGNKTARTAEPYQLVLKSSHWYPSLPGCNRRVAEGQLRGRGVAYCVACDGMMYRNTAGFKHLSGTPEEQRSEISCPVCLQSVT